MGIGIQGAWGLLGGNSFLSLESFVPLELVDSYIAVRFRCGSIWLSLFTFEGSVCDLAKAPSLALPR
jgi:hypothetical protein